MEVRQERGCWGVHQPLSFFWELVGRVTLLVPVSYFLSETEWCLYQPGPLWGLSSQKMDGVSQLLVPLFLLLYLFAPYK